MRARTIYLSLLCTVATTACVFSARPVYYERDMALAMEHIERFHNYLNRGEYDRIYDLFNQRVQSEQSRERFVEKLQAFHESAGVFKRFSLLKKQVVPQADFRIVNIVIDSEYEKSRTLEEFDCFVNNDTVVFDFYGQPPTDSELRRTPTSAYPDL